MPRQGRDTARAPRIIGMTTAMLLTLSVTAMAQQANNPQDKEHHTVNQQTAHVFPAVGHSYRVDFGGGNAFEIAFGHNSDMTFTKLQPPNQGSVETIHYTYKQLRDGLYMVYWQENDKTTVVHVEDFERGIVYSNITSPNGNFFNGYSKLERVNSAPIPAHQVLSTEVFNPGESAIFAVSSIIVEGKKDAVLIDAQFSADQARKLAEKIKSSGKRLTTIYISHSDPDYYFGLDTLHAAFPNAKILATPETIAHIEATKDEKLKIWGPQLGQNAPASIIVPQPLEGNTLTLEGQKLEIIGLDGPTPDRTFVWIPSIKTVAGGISVFAGLNIWMADTQTPESHKHWLATLSRIKALHPTSVIPGHFVGNAPMDLRTVDFTSEYIRTFDQETARAKNSAELIAAMKQHYPNLGGGSSLEVSAKVAKGEMEWK